MKKVETENSESIDNLNEKNNKRKLSNEMIFLGESKKNTNNSEINNNITEMEDNLDLQSNSTLQISTNINQEESKIIDIKSGFFPYCIVWTPIPLLTYLIPSIGHTGICNSCGIIHDFAGSFFVSIDDFAFGKPTKYIQLQLTDKERKIWDRAIERGDNKYNMEEHNLFCNNCHSHVAYVLNQVKYKGKNNYNMFNIWWLLITEGKYISIGSFIKSYIGFIIILFLFIFFKLFT